MEEKTFARAGGRWNPLSRPPKEFWAMARVHRRRSAQSAKENGLVSGLQDHRYLSVTEDGPQSPPASRDGGPPPGQRGRFVAEMPHTYGSKGEPLSQPPLLLRLKRQPPRANVPSPSPGHADGICRRNNNRHTAHTTMPHGAQGTETTTAPQMTHEHSPPPPPHLRVPKGGGRSTACIMAAANGAKRGCGGP